VQDIAARYGHTAPAGTALTRWAVWQFPLNDYLAMAPAALEAAGVELPEHYAVTEAREGRRKAKAAALQKLTPHE